VVDYFAKYHTKNFYHGDIKPDNIFIFDVDYDITSDGGSLLYLGETDLKADDPRFIITEFTQGFASRELI
jgi:hypothetical protein